jgi:hypothetical protein
MPALNKREDAMKKTMAKAAPGNTRTKGPMGTRFPSKPASKDKQFEGTIGSQSKKIKGF